MYLRRYTHEAYIYEDIDICTHKLISVKILTYTHTHEHVCEDINIWTRS